MAPSIRSALPRSPGSRLVAPFEALREAAEQEESEPAFDLRLKEMLGEGLSRPEPGQGWGS